MGVNGEALQLHTVYKWPYFYYKSRENPYQYCKSRKNPYQVLQVTRLLPLALLLVLRTRNNTDGNKFVIFSGIALYYGDTYIIM